MKRFMSVALIVAVVAVLSGDSAKSAPKPSPVPIRWQLDIETSHPKTINVTLPGHSRPQLFWFIRYTITNETGQDVIFVPDFVLYTDTGQIIPAGQRVPTAVFKAIKKLYNEPLLKDMTGITGKILQGEDKAKEGLAIWRDYDPKAGQFDIFIGGLSGETEEIRLPKPIDVVELDSRGNTKTVRKNRTVITKTLNLAYSVPGEAAFRHLAKPKLLRKEWVMR